MTRTRRDFLKSVVAIATISPARNVLADEKDRLGVVHEEGRRRIRVAAIQMHPKMGDVAANLEKTQRLAQ